MTAPLGPDAAAIAAALTFEGFSVANRARCEASDGFNHKLASWSLSDWFTAILGELGEAANVAKKLNRIRDGIPGNKQPEAELREQLRRELADAFIYLDLTAQSAGFRLGDVVEDVFNRKSAEIGYPVVLAADAGLAALVKEHDDLLKSHEIVDRQNDKLTAQLVTLREALANMFPLTKHDWDVGEQRCAHCAKAKAALAATAPKAGTA